MVSRPPLAILLVKDAAEPESRGDERLHDLGKNHVGHENDERDHGVGLQRELLGRVLLQFFVQHVAPHSAAVEKMPTSTATNTNPCCPRTPRKPTFSPRRCDPEDEWRRRIRRAARRSTRSWPRARFPRSTVRRILCPPRWRAWRDPYATTAASPSRPIWARRLALSPPPSAPTRDGSTRAWRRKMQPRLTIRVMKLMRMNSSASFDLQPEYSVLPRR